MSLVLARGEQAKENATKEKVDLSKVFYRFKAGDSAKVRVLSTMDYVEYKAHSDFNHKVWTQPCVGVTGAECAFCKASKAGIKDFEALFAKHRYLFVFGDLATGELMALDVSKNQAKKLIADIEEYKDYINTHCFNLVRTGAGTDSAFSLKVNIKTPAGKDKESFDNFEGLIIADEFFGGLLQARPLTMQINILKDAGFPVEKHFSAELLAEAERAKAEAEGATGATAPATPTAPIAPAENEDDLPF